MMKFALSCIFVFSRRVVCITKHVIAHFGVVKTVCSAFIRLRTFPYVHVSLTLDGCVIICHHFQSPRLHD